MGTAARKATTSLADALFTATQQRVLAPLFAQPDRSFIQQDLIDRAGGGSGAVRRELARLVESGLVRATVVGRQKHFQANRRAPIFHELRGIVVKTVAITDPLRAALRPLAKRIELALVYGSVARGEDRAQSDIDLLVVADALMLEELFARLAPAEKKLGRAISPTLYTRADFERRRRGGNPFLKKVLSGEHLILIGALGDDDESR
ncbi:MAG TPA: nucleotidyltransferase domain-containing protein [Thermoanaerobaculia bacterium]|nr:nucleotidyltransferase domain-containing protein [Thermoanaerobaculia bacterium]